MGWDTPPNMCHQSIFKDLDTNLQWQVLTYMWHQVYFNNGGSEGVNQYSNKRKLGNCTKQFIAITNLSKCCSLGFVKPFY